MYNKTIAAITPTPTIMPMIDERDKFPARSDGGRGGGGGSRVPLAVGGNKVRVGPTFAEGVDDDVGILGVNG
jgi:hypothetical protein